MTEFVSNLKVALCQVQVGADKEVNIRKIEEAISSTDSAQLVVLPECWNSPYGISFFPKYAEPVPNAGESIDETASPSIAALSKKAKERGIWIVGGSIPERDGDKLYNTCTVYNPEGVIVAKHRKIHLFDINVPGKIVFKESDSLSPGSTPTIFDTPWGPIGVGICYDIRFPEYAAMLRQKGARILVYPGAFNMVTGPAHWELLQRARAVDNQVYVLSCSPARDENSGGYVAWGHSSVITPWAEVIATCDGPEAIVTAELDLKKVDEMRENIPCWKQKRHDLYEIVSKI